MSRAPFFLRGQRSFSGLVREVARVELYISDLFAVFPHFFAPFFPGKIGEKVRKECEYVRLGIPHVPNIQIRMFLTI